MTEAGARKVREAEEMALAQAVRYALAPHSGLLPGHDEARVAG